MIRVPALKDLGSTRSPEGLPASEVFKQMLYYDSPAFNNKVTTALAKSWKQQEWPDSSMDAKSFKRFSQVFGSMAANSTSLTQKQLANRHSQIVNLTECLAANGSLNQEQHLSLLGVESTYEKCLKRLSRQEQTAAMLKRVWTEPLFKPREADEEWIALLPLQKRASKSMDEEEIALFAKEIVAIADQTVNSDENLRVAKILETFASMHSDKDLLELGKNFSCPDNRLPVETLRTMLSSKTPHFYSFLLTQGAYLLEDSPYSLNTPGAA